MTDYRLFGADTSPYSLKVRAFLRYKGLAFDWISRSRANEADFQANAQQVATVPLLISPSRPASQDSTAMLAALEADHPEPSAVPDDPACAVLALMLEDYGDEWLNKCMFQQRWGQSPDREAAALRVLTQLYDGKLPRARKAPQTQIAERMAARLPLVGAEAENWETLENSWRRFAGLLNDHLKDHLFLFGGRPTVADFAIAAQFQQMLLDPTPARWLEDRAPFLVAWCEHMEDPHAGGPFEYLATLGKTLAPLFAEELSLTYLPWASANAASASRNKKRFSATLGDGIFEQSTQRYAARSFQSVRAAVAKSADNTPLQDFLEATGAKKHL
ncbi:MAG: glutathione S-transferase family protein [Hyphomonas sp.]